MTRKSKPQRERLEAADRPSEELRAELLRIVRLIVDPPEEQTEDEQGDLVDQWSELCPHPGGSNIIFWPNELGLCDAMQVRDFQMSPEEMVAYALNWEPRVVAMRVEQRSGSEFVGYFIYKLTSPDTPKTQVTTSLQERYEQGATVAVALRGMQLADGTIVKSTFPFRTYSCGRILGATELPVGARIVGHPGVIDTTSPNSRLE